jgi:hypothetical protein
VTSVVGLIVIVLGAIAVCGYSVVALYSADLLWLAGGAVLPDPLRIVIRVDGVETVLTKHSPGYDVITEGARQAMSSFKAWGLGSLGLTEDTLELYQREGTIVEIYFDEPVDFHQPFRDGQPTALLFPIEGRNGGKGYVLRGRDGEWWAGSKIMRDPRPLLHALASLGYIEE